MTSVAENVTLKAMHQLLNVIVLPLIGVISVYGLAQFQKLHAEINAVTVEVVKLNAIEQRLDRLEIQSQATTQNLIDRPRFDSRDAQTMETRILNMIEKIRQEIREERRHRHSGDTPF